MSQPSKSLGKVNSEGYEATIWWTGTKGFMVGDMDSDTDGSGSAHGDHTHLPDTSLHYQGKPLNADEDFFIVLPRAAITSVKPIVLGCQARVTNLATGVVKMAVVGDSGPANKIGEGSYILLKSLALDPNPVHGGLDTPEILYEWFPGVAANVNGKQYSLQPS